MESEPIREIQFVYYLFTGLFVFFVAVLVRAFVKRRRNRDGK